eukprot:COSAG01_NODE_6802_length_3493_cov_3.551856_3_plen_381_part_01
MPCSERLPCHASSTATHARAPASDGLQSRAGRGGKAAGGGRTSRPARSDSIDAVRRSTAGRTHSYHLHLGPSPPPPLRRRLLLLRRRTGGCCCSFPNPLWDPLLIRARRRTVAAHRRRSRRRRGSGRGGRSLLVVHRGQQVLRSLRRRDADASAAAASKGRATAHSKRASRTVRQGVHLLLLSLPRLWLRLRQQQHVPAYARTLLWVSAVVAAGCKVLDTFIQPTVFQGPCCRTRGRIDSLVQELSAAVAAAAARRAVSHKIGRAVAGRVAVPPRSAQLRVHRPWTGSVRRCHAQYRSLGTLIAAATATSSTCGGPPCQATVRCSHVSTAMAYFVSTMRRSTFTIFDFTPSSYFSRILSQNSAQSQLLLWDCFADSLFLTE